MPFVKSELERVAGGAKKLFIYNAGADAIAAVSAADYFLSKKDELDKGDVIIVLGANMTTVDLLVVTSLRSAASVTTIGTEGITAT